MTAQAPHHPAPKLIPGLSTVADAYDTFLLDLWGVLHDGVTPFDGALACLQQLRRAGKRIALLSNTPRRASAAVSLLESIGFPRATYDFLLTSGELTHLALRDRPDAWLAGLGDKPWIICDDTTYDLSILENLSLSPAATPGEASFVLNIGPSAQRSALTAWQSDLQACRAADLRMICANPDLACIHNGIFWLCGGTLAAHYASLGGDVRYYGKPHRAIFQQALQATDTVPARALMIGDSLATDMRGAHEAGIDGLFITGGMHLQDLGNVWGKAPEAATLAAFCTRAELHPRWATPALNW